MFLLFTFTSRRRDRKSVSNFRGEKMRHDKLELHHLPVIYFLDFRSVLSTFSSSSSSNEHTPPLECDAKDLSLSATPRQHKHLFPHLHLHHLRVTAARCGVFTLLRTQNLCVEQRALHFLGDESYARQEQISGGGKTQLKG